jgi:hypothetical protein
MDGTGSTAMTFYRGTPQPLSSSFTSESSSSIDLYYLWRRYVAFEVASSSDLNELSSSVALSDTDSSDVWYAALGMPGYDDSEGAVRICKMSGTTISSTTDIQPTDLGEDYYTGWSVAMNDAGDTVAFGAPGSPSSSGAIPFYGATVGKAYIWTRSGTTWSQEADIEAELTDGANQNNGTAISLSKDGNSLVVGSPQIYIRHYTRSGTTWTKIAQITVPGGSSASGGFSESLQISGDGNYIVAGAWKNNRAFVYSLSGSTWTQTEISEGDTGSIYDYNYGRSVAINHNGDIIAVGQSSWYEATDCKVYILKRSGTTWSLDQTISNPNWLHDDDPHVRYGEKVALNGAGDRLIVSGVITATDGGSPPMGSSGLSVHAQFDYHLDADGDFVLEEQFSDTGAHGGGAPLELSRDTTSVIFGNSFYDSDANNGRAVAYHKKE